MEALLVELDQDHPGFRDLNYRSRRDAIARIAWEYQAGQPVPDAPYTEEEHGVWRTIFETLTPVHDKRVCREMNRVQAELALDRQRIPQLREVNVALAAVGPFSLEPVAGLVTPRIFLERLGQGVFLSTQYIRHHSRPLYTPEPDVVHELIGHAAALTHPRIAELSIAFGHAALVADEAVMDQLIKLFWYTLEFGAVEEDGEVKAYGAGLLSSAGELERFVHEAELLPWDIERIAITSFDPTDYQPQIFVAPSFEQMADDLAQWLGYLELAEPLVQGSLSSKQSPGSVGSR